MSLQYTSQLQTSTRLQDNGIQAYLGALKIIPVKRLTYRYSGIQGMVKRGAGSMRGKSSTTTSFFTSYAACHGCKPKLSDYFIRRGLYIFDKVHRLMKCKYLGIEKINCVKFIKTRSQVMFNRDKYSKTIEDINIAITVHERMIAWYQDYGIEA